MVLVGNFLNILIFFFNFRKRPASNDLKEPSKKGRQQTNSENVSDNKNGISLYKNFGAIAHKVVSAFHKFLKFKCSFF